MRNSIFILSLFLLFNCSSHKAQKQEEEFNQEATQKEKEKIVSSIQSTSYSNFLDSISGKILKGTPQFHNYVASNCNKRAHKVTEQMALSLIQRESEPREESYSESSLLLKAPLLNSLENGCSSLVGVYLENMSAKDVAKASLNLSAIDFISFTEKITGNDPLTSDLSRMEEIPFSVDMAIGKNSELCLSNQKNCKARDHLLNEYNLMKEAVAKFAYYKACTIQVDLINKVQLMNEQIEFGKLTGTASPQTYDAHASEAQELRGWYRYYQGLFFKTTGEDANLSGCVL